MTRPFDLLKRIIFLFGCTLTAQDAVPDYNFHAIKESSSQRAVSSIVQDSAGLIWMGTNGVGLSRFNGIDFTYYQQQSTDTTSVSGSLIYTTFIDRRDRLWVGSQTGLDRYDRASGHFIRIDLTPGTDVSEGIPIKCIGEDALGNIIVGTLQHGTFLIDGTTFESIPVPLEGISNLDALLVNSVAGDRDRSFIGTNMGLFEYSSPKKEFIAVYEGESQTKKVLDDIQSLYLDSDTNLWMGTLASGVKKIAFSHRNGSLAHFPITDKRVLSIV